MKAAFVITAIGIAIIGFGVVGQVTAAGTRDPGVNARQHHQKQRVRQGVRSGQLTRREARGLRAEHRNIKQLERSYKSDGTLSSAERRDLHRQLNRNSRTIYRQKHDVQRRNFGGSGAGNPGSSSAKSPSARDRLVNARQKNQTDRIRRGIRSGALTKSETKQLVEERRDIKQFERAYKSDGALTTAERRDLHGELSELSRDIRVEKHDAQQR